MTSDADKIAFLENRVAELEELCGLQGTLGINPFDGSHRVRVLVVAKLFAVREFVTKETVALAIGGENFSDRTVAVYVHFLRKQLPEGIVIKTEWGRGWSISAPHREKLRAFLAGDVA